jgi:hypothetical protein
MIDDVMNRLKVKRGESLPQSKLNEEIVIEARNAHASGMEAVKEIHSNYSIKALADHYGVHVRTMERAISGETWSHIA